MYLYIPIILTIDNIILHYRRTFKIFQYLAPLYFNKRVHSYCFCIVISHRRINRSSNNLG